MDKNLENYWVICHETWHTGSSDAPSKTLCCIFENFNFLGRLHRTEGQKMGKIPKIQDLTQSRGATSQKIKVFKISAQGLCRSTRWTRLPSFMTNGPVDSQIVVHLCEVWLFLSPFSCINASNRVNPPLTPTAISQQLFWVERQMSPFWKLEDQGYKITEIPADPKFLTGPHPM